MNVIKYIILSAVQYMCTKDAIFIPFPSDKRFESILL